MLSAITVGRLELADRCARLQPGMRAPEVREVLGSDEFKVEERQGRTMRFWRFRLSDALHPSGEYEIFLAEFQDEAYVEGAVLPQG